MDKIIEAMRKQGATDADIEAYVRSIGGVEAGPPKAKVPSPKQIERLNTNDREMAEAETPSYRERAGGAVANLVRDIPGADAFIAGLGTLRGQPYTESLAALRQAQGTTPTAARIPARLVGGITAAAMAPGATALRQGLLLGAAEGIGRAEPTSVAGRAGNTAIGGLLGAVGGKVAEQVGTGVRALIAPSAGKAALVRRGAIADKDAALYGRADIEGLLTPSTPKLQHELTSRTIMPYFERVRGSEAFQGASDAEIARETYKTMSEVQGKLLRQQEGSPDFLANARLQAKEIGLAKERLLTAMKTSMPTYPKAVKTHATGMQEFDAMKKGLDAARRAIGSKDVSGRKIEMESPEAFVKSVEKMTPAQAQAAIEGVLGAVKRAPKLTSNVLSGFGVFSSAARTPLALMRVQPFLHALDRKAGTGSVARAMEAAGIAVTLPTTGLLAERK